MTPFIGQIMPVGFSFAPRGWTLCDGQLLSISAYTAVYSLLGTTFGGDGRTTFGIPPLRGRTMVGVGNGPGLQTISWGEKAGSNTTTLTTNNLPSHFHALNGTSSAATVNFNTEGADGTGSVLANPGRNSEDAEGTISGGVTGFSGNTGNGVAFNNMQPYLGVYICIALTGVYPSRN